MKRLVKIIAVCTAAVLSAAVLPASLKATTPEEILEQMDKALDNADTKGAYFVMEMKMPILGTIPAKIWSLGEKTRMETGAGDKDIIIWYDKETHWEYNISKNEITIKNNKKDEEESSEKSKSEEGMGMFEDMDEGYDMILEKETATEWHILFKKSKSNKEKDDPKKMNLIVSKTTNLPISLKASLKGVTMTIRDVAVGGFTEDFVTFHPGDYPNAKIIDTR